MFRLCSIIMHRLSIKVKFLYVVLILQWCNSVTLAQSILFRPFGTKEYYIENNSFVRTYAQAEETCNASGATLALVNRMEIGQFLLGQIGNITDPPYSFFIGLRRIENTSGLSQFAWVDGTPLSSTWSNWFTGEPNNFAVNRADKENCVIMGWTFDLDSTFRWRDVSCSFISRVICERTVESTASITSTATTATEVSTPRDTTASITSTSITTTAATTAKSFAPISTSSQEIIIYAAIGGGGFLVVMIIISTACICHHRKKKQPKSNSHDPNVIYETIEESSYASRPPTVYNEIYKSADYNGFRNGGYPGHHGRQGTNTYSQIYLRPDGSLFQDHAEPPQVPSTLPKIDKKANTNATNV